MKAVKVEGVQIKLEPSTTLRPRNASASSPPNTSYLSGARKGSDRPSAAPGEEGVLKSDNAPRTKRRRKIEEPSVKLESDVEPKVELEGIDISPSSPFPNFVRPTAEECRVSVVGLDVCPFESLAKSLSWTSCKVIYHVTAITGSARCPSTVAWRATAAQTDCARKGRSSS